MISDNGYLKSFLNLLLKCNDMVVRISKPVA